MTGRDLILFILENNLENYSMVFRRDKDKNIDNKTWEDLKKEDIVKGVGILILEHPDIKRK